MRLRNKLAVLLAVSVIPITITMTAAQPASAAQYVRIVSDYWTGCLTTEKDDPATDYQDVSQVQCAQGNDYQMWLPIGLDNSGHYQFQNKAFALCMEAHEGAVFKAHIFLWPCNSISNERWTWTAGFNNPSPAFLRSNVSGTNNWCLSHEPSFPDSPVYLAGCVGLRELWYIQTV
jgi:hypothetical protein